MPWGYAICGRGCMEKHSAWRLLGYILIILAVVFAALGVGIWMMAPDVGHVSNNDMLFVLAAGVCLVVGILMITEGRAGNGDDGKKHGGNKPMGTGKAM